MTYRYDIFSKHFIISPLLNMNVLALILLGIINESFSEWDGTGCPKGATGAFPYALDCKRFYNCWKGRGMLSVCAPGTLFNSETLECDFPLKVKCYTNPNLDPSKLSSNYEEFRDPQNPYHHHYHKDAGLRQNPNYVHSPEYHKNVGQVPVEPFFQHSPQYHGGYHNGDISRKNLETQEPQNFQHSPGYHGKVLFNPAAQQGYEGHHHHHHHHHPPHQHIAGYPQQHNPNGKNVRFPSQDLQPPGDPKYVPVDGRYNERPTIRPAPSRDLKPPEPAWSSTHGGVQPPKPPQSFNSLSSNPKTKNPFAKGTPDYQESPYGTIEKGSASWPPKFPQVDEVPEVPEIPEVTETPELPEVAEIPELPETYDSYGLKTPNYNKLPQPQNRGEQYPKEYPPPKSPQFNPSPLPNQYPIQGFKPNKIGPQNQGYQPQSNPQFNQGPPTNQGFQPPVYPEYPQPNWGSKSSPGPLPNQYPNQGYQPQSGPVYAEYPQPNQGYIPPSNSPQNPGPKQGFKPPSPVFNPGEYPQPNQGYQPTQAPEQYQPTPNGQQPEYEETLEDSKREPKYQPGQELPYPSMFNRKDSGLQSSPTNSIATYVPPGNRGGFNPNGNPLRTEQASGFDRCPEGFSGLSPHSDCNKFLSCANGRTYVMNCAPGTRFSPDLSICDHAYKVKCGDETVPDPEPQPEPRPEPQPEPQPPYDGNDYLQPAESINDKPIVVLPDVKPEIDVRFGNERQYVEIDRKPTTSQPEKGFFIKPDKSVVTVNKSVEIVTAKTVKNPTPAPQPKKFQPGEIAEPKVIFGKQIQNRQIVRLRGGPTQYQGYVEISINHTWGTVCDQQNQWTQNEANIVCRNLGYTRGAESSWQGKPASVTEVVSPSVAVDVVRCVGDEESLLDCFMTNNPFCDVNNDAVWVRCYDNIKSQCRPGEISIGDRCYFVVVPSEDTADVGFTQGEAISHCQKHGGHLLSIGSQIENDFLSEWLMRQSQLESVMTAGVGVSVMGMPIWIWEGSEEAFAYNNWWPGWRSTKAVAPKLETGRASCIVMRRFFPCTDLDTKEGRLCDAQYYFWDVDDCGTMSTRMPYICKRPANKIGCIINSGINYRGGANVTNQGNLCLSWDSKEVSPFLKYKISDEDKRLSLSGHNFCRNVGGTDVEPWCFVKSKDVIQKEYCDIPFCSKERTEKSAKYSDYKCAPKQFSCEDKHECILQEWVCDGKPDCSNAKDELDCGEPVEKFQLYEHTKLPGYDIQKLANSTLKHCAEKCLENENCRSFYYLEISKQCFLSESNVGLSGNLISNEIGWNYYERKAKSLRCSGLFVCDNGKCLGHSSICNGKDDCGDKSDEKNCTWLEKGVEMRLMGEKENEGTIEIKANDQWGLICDDQFDMNDAHVICRHLGFQNGALEIIKHSPSNFTKYLLDDLNCLGNESLITECQHSGWGVHNCGADEAAGVICKLQDVGCSNNFWLCDSKAECIPLNFLCDNVSDCTDGSDEIASRCSSPVEVRLVDGISKNNKMTEGRLEVRRFGVWGTVCDDDFGDKEAEVICNSLGYEGPAKVFKEAAFGAGSGIIWLDQVHCSGNETNVAECLHDSWGSTNCKHNEDVAVACSPQKININVGQQVEDENPEPKLTLEDILPRTCGIVSPDVGPISTPFKPKVVSGFETLKGSYPWQASVRVKSVSGQSTHWCGAIVVSRYHILTAGHCLRDYVKSSYLIRAGDFDTEVIEGTEQDLDLEGIWIHQDLDKKTRLNNDIALVKVKKPGFNLNKWVYPACLPMKSNYASGKNCSISGWGSNGVPGSGFARTLHAAWLPIVDQSKCRRSYDRKSITDGMFCAGSLRGGGDSCQGDSGGPFVCPEKEGMTLYGITSWGHGCGRVDSPGVYTNVSFFMDWIREKIENSM